MRTCIPGTRKRKSVENGRNTTIVLTLLLAVISTGVSAQTLLEVGTTVEGQQFASHLAPALVNGSIQPVVFGQNGSPGLTVRPQRPLLCARSGMAPSNPLKQVVLDMNGHFEPVSLANQAKTMEGGDLIYGQEAFIRGSEALRFNTGTFVTVNNQFAFDVEGVDAYCVLTPDTDVTPIASTCNTVSSSDVIFDDSYELQAPGTLHLTVHSQQVGVNINYQYVLTAINGPVYEVNLREQFPYFLIESPDTPTFQKSLALQANWTCAASDGASCDKRGQGLDGAGYIHLENGRIDQGACLKVTASRYLRSDGIEAAHPFNGRLHAGALYVRAPGEQTSAQRSSTSLRHLFAQ